jgi:DNA invertase Pin-like site-specific DNA recombinase
MNLTNNVKELIKDSTRIRNLIAAELGCSEQSVRRWINENEPDNDLTKASALKVIREETGLSDDEILTETVAAEK